MGARPTKRVAYVGVGYALVPLSDAEPHLLVRVSTNVLFFDCVMCGALAGQMCIDKRGSRMRNGHYRGRGRGRWMVDPDRVAMCSGLIAAGRYDEILILDTRTVIRRRR